MLIVNSLNPPNRYGNIAVTRVLFIFEKKCTMSLVPRFPLSTTISHQRNLMSSYVLVTKDSNIGVSIDVHVLPLTHVKILDQWSNKIGTIHTF